MQFTNWRKPTRSNGTGNCVEVADSGGLWAVRDSKNRDGGMLVVDSAAWATFIANVKSGQYDR